MVVFVGCVCVCVCMWRPEVHISLNCSPSNFKITYIYIYVHVRVGTHIPWYMFRGQRTTQRNHFSPSTVFVLGNELMSLGLVVNSPTY